MIPWEGFIHILKGVTFQIHVVLFDGIARTILLIDGHSLELPKVTVVTQAAAHKSKPPHCDHSVPLPLLWKGIETRL